MRLSTLLCAFFAGICATGIVVGQVQESWVHVEASSESLYDAPQALALEDGISGPAALITSNTSVRVLHFLTSQGAPGSSRSRRDGSGEQCGAADRRRRPRRS